MKTLINLLHKTEKVLFAILMILFIIPGCSLNDSDTEMLNHTTNESQLKSKIVKQDTVYLEGYTRFAFLVKNEGTYITDGYTSNFLQCEAKMTFEGDKGFKLWTKEYMDMGQGPFLFREIAFEGKITPSGQLKFYWPEFWLQLGHQTTDVIGTLKLHTGMQVSGPGISKNTLFYNGSYDGEFFFAATHLNGLQQEPGTLPFFQTMVEGPVLVRFMIDLTKVDE